MNPSSSAPRSLGSLLALVLALLSLAPAAWALAPGDVEQVHAHLKRAETNLQLVDGSIGHLKSPPKGSAGKLAKLRLAQALPDLEAAETLLKGLSGEGVAEAQTRYDAAHQLHEKLDGILKGTPAPKPEPTPEPTPTPTPDPTPEPAPKPAPESGGTPPKEAPPEPKTVKLGYPHADNFKNALFTLRRVEAEATAYFAEQMELRAVEDQLTVSHRATAKALNGIAETRRQAGFVDKGLAALPSNGEGVADAKERLAAVNANLDAAQAYFHPLDARLAKLIDPAGYPDYPTDLKRLRELGTMYANPVVQLDQQRPRAIEALAQAEAAEAECLRIARVYARLMQQATEQGKQIEIAGNGFLRTKQAFLEVAAERRASLPASIRRDLAEADGYANDAVREQKPMWFTGGIPQRLEWIADKLALYHALDPAKAAALQKEVDGVVASIDQRADSLRELIIRENTMPADGFFGADRDAAIAIAKDAWNIQEKGFELLAVRIPAQAWARETKWTYSNGTWYFVDRSRLQVRLIVADASNPELAIDRPIDVYKDHQKGDTMIGVPMRSLDEALQPSEYLLRDRVR